MQEVNYLRKVFEYFTNALRVEMRDGFIGAMKLNKATFYGKMKNGNWTRQESDWMVKWALDHGYPIAYLREHETDPSDLFFAETDRNTNPAA